MSAAWPAPTRAVAWIVALLLVMIGTLYLTNALEAEYPWINHDVGYHTYLGAEMARGLRLYVDLKEDNPPGSPLLLGGAFVVAERLGLPDFFAPHLLVLLIGAAGFGVLRYALAGAADGWPRALTALAYLLVVIRGGFANSIVLEDPGVPYDFAQREHLFSLLFVPYLFARWMRSGNPWWLLAYAVPLGWVSTFKPFWPPMIVLVEAFVAWKRRRFDRRPAAFLFGGMLAPFVVLGLHSFDSLARFAGENIPMYLRGGYDFYEKSYAAFLGTPLHHLMLAGAVGLVGAVVWGVRNGAFSRETAALFVVLAAAAYFAVWHQGKFWSYHTMPFFALTLVPTAFLAARAAAHSRHERLGRLLPPAAAALLLLAAGATVAGTARMLTRYPPLGSFLCPVVKPFDRVMYFSMSVMVQYPPLRLRREMVGPWTVFLDLPELLALPDAAERERRVGEFAGEVRATIERERPELLVFSPQGQALPDGATLFEVLDGIGALPLAGYRPVSARAFGVTDPWIEGWRLYQRVDTRPESRP